jgi:hypothetical protein
MDQGFQSVMTETEAADFLGVPVEAIALWAREEQLPVAARSEGGQLLFYRWRIERDGAALAAFAPIRWPSGEGRARQEPSKSEYQTLDCGCRLIPAPGRLCRTGAALLAAAALSEDIAASASGDSFLSKLAGLCRDALARHLAGPLAERPRPRQGPSLPLEVGAAIERLEGRDHNCTDVVAGDCTSAEGDEASQPIGTVPRLSSAPVSEAIADREAHVT